MIDQLHPTLRQPLLSITEAINSLETNDPLRIAELNNIRQAVIGATECLLEGDFHEYDEIMNVVAKRVNALAEDTQSAGTHEQFR